MNEGVAVDSVANYGTSGMHVGVAVYVKEVGVACALYGSVAGKAACYSCACNMHSTSSVHIT